MTFLHFQLFFWKSFRYFLASSQSSLVNYFTQYCIYSEPVLSFLMNSFKVSLTWVYMGRFRNLAIIIENTFRLIYAKESPSSSKSSSFISSASSKSSMSNPAYSTLKKLLQEYKQLRHIYFRPCFHISESLVIAFFNLEDAGK